MQRRRDERALISSTNIAPDLQRNVPVQCSLQRNVPVQCSHSERIQTDPPEELQVNAVNASYDQPSSGSLIEDESPTNAVAVPLAQDLYVGD